MAIYKIIKRNGAITTFDKNKIIEAIQKAMEAVSYTEQHEAEALTNEVMKQIEVKHHNEMPSVESVQDIVEYVLTSSGLHEVAKSYIIYRQKRAEARKAKDVVVEVGKTMDEYL